MYPSSRQPPYLPVDLQAILFPKGFYRIKVKNLFIRLPLKYFLNSPKLLLIGRIFKGLLQNLPYLYPFLISGKFCLQPDRLSFFSELSSSDMILSALHSLYSQNQSENTYRKPLRFEIFIERNKLLSK